MAHSLASDGGSRLKAPKNQRREIIAWCLYDWANSAYSTIYITVLVGYLMGGVLPGPDGKPSDAALTVWGWGIAVTTLLCAILSPLLGAIADKHANKRTWLAITTMLGATASVLMFFGTPEHPWWFVAMFLIANLNYELVQSFYNAFLPEITDDRRMSEVSGWGYGTGYVGGGLMLVVAVVVLKYGESLGLPTENAFLARFCLLIMGLWWAVFSLPMLLIVRDRAEPRRTGESVLQTSMAAMRDVKRTLLDIRRYRMLAIFLIGFLIFNDGVMTVISQASVYAQNKFGMTEEDLVPLFLMIQFVALPGAVFLGWLANKIGQKTALQICLGIWVLVLLSGFVIETVPQFYVMSAVTALVMGGTQSISRTIMGLMTPEAKTGEFFGFFNLSGKAFSLLGPIMFTEILKRTESAQWAILSLLVFFVIGWLIIIPLNIARGQQQAREGVDAV